MGEFIVRALFLAHKLLLVSFFLSFNKVFESEVERELLLRRLYHLFTPLIQPLMAERLASRKKKEPSLPSRSCKACKEMHWMPDCPYIKQAQARGGIHYRKDRRGMGKHCMCCGHN